MIQSFLLIHLVHRWSLLDHTVSLSLIEQYTTIITMQKIKIKKQIWSAPGNVKNSGHFVLREISFMYRDMKM